MEKADEAFTDIEEKKGRIVAVMGGHGDVEVQAHCKPDGVVSLKAVAISRFRTVRVPRVWDNPQRREAERDPRDELGRLARKFKTALDEWAERRQVYRVLTTDRRDFSTIRIDRRLSRALEFLP